MRGSRLRSLVGVVAGVALGIGALGGCSGSDGSDGGGAVGTVPPTVLQTSPEQTTTTLDPEEVALQEAEARRAYVDDLRARLAALGTPAEGAECVTGLVDDAMQDGRAAAELTTGYVECGVSPAVVVAAQVARLAEEGGASQEAAACLAAEISTLSLEEIDALGAAGADVAGLLAPSLERCDLSADVLGG